MSEADHSSIIELLASATTGAAEGVTAIQQVGLASLIDGRPITIEEIALDADLPVEEIRRGIEALAAAGRIEVDGEIVTGVGGLTTSTTVHELRLPEAAMHTWCALDAIGIPVAFGVDAQLTTACPYCDDRLEVEIVGGAASGADGLRLFCPTGPCRDVRSDFCASTNLFCNPGHLAAWRHDRGAPEGASLTLDEAVDLGRRMWAPHTGG